MSVNPFSASNLCLLLISAGLIGYLFFLWQVVKQKAPSKDLAIVRRPVKRFVTVYAVYFTGISVLAANHFFDVESMPPRFLLVFLPLLFIVVLLSRAKLDGSLLFIRYLPPVMLVTVHVYRLLIELVFLQFENEKIIPGEMSIHGRNYDLWIGVLALPVGYLFAKGHRMARKAGILFNVAGLLSLANIFTIVVPSIPSPFRVNDMLYLPTYFPGIMIVFLASAAIFLHILSLRQLLAIKSRCFPQKSGAKPLAKDLLPQ